MVYQADGQLWMMEKKVGSNLITFIVNGTEYQAEEGMTWGEWVDSEYNVNRDFEIDPFDNSIAHGSRYVSNDEDYIFASDIIQEGYDYVLVR